MDYEVILVFFLLWKVLNSFSTSSARDLRHACGFVARSTPKSISLEGMSLGNQPGNFYSRVNQEDQEVAVL